MEQERIHEPAHKMFFLCLLTRELRKLERMLIWAMEQDSGFRAH